MGSRYEDFEEEDVWGVMEDNNNNNNNYNYNNNNNNGKEIRKSMKDSTFFTTNNNNNNNSSSSRNFTVVNAPRMIPRSSSSETVSSKQSSAPLDIPDWSKIYGHTSKNKNGTSSSSSWLNNNNNNKISDGIVNGHHHHHDGYHNTYGNCMSDHHHHQNFNGNGYNGNCNGYNYDDDDDGDDNDDDDMVPPHEYLARKLARNQISSFSVYEGIGRTLKGRDLSKVRNTILSKTGFLE